MNKIEKFAGTDLEIAQKVYPDFALPMEKIAEKAGIPSAYIEHYGKHKAKVDYSFLLNSEANKKDGKLILVTAINPTPLGEGKTTTTVGLSDALSKIGKRVMVVLREPALGPVFGSKGGAAGGGWAQVIPMEDINLHFTGDIHAVSAANNLLAALIDNHIYQGNKLNLDTRKISWRRCIDMNDRQLRYTVNGLGGKGNGVPREEGYDITPASEVMAILCLATSIEDLKERLGRIIIGYTTEPRKGEDRPGERPVTASELKAEGAMALLLKDALKPNLVQTLEATPALLHGGPFANIAHGCNSLMATKLALKCSDYAVTEAGFGADLGAEKFIHIKCRSGSLKPSAAVIVCTVRALKSHGGLKRQELEKENLPALEKGMPNLLRHIENMISVFSIPALVAINVFPKDTDAEINLIKKACNALGVKAIVSEVWAKGGEGGMDLATEVVKLCEKEQDFPFLYDLNQSIKEKIEIIAKRVYRAGNVVILSDAMKEIRNLEKLGLDKLPICMAKTQYSFSDNPSLLGAPEDWTLTVRDIKISAGAGFIIALTGEINTMPGLPPNPSAEKMDIDKTGRISGLF